MPPHQPSAIQMGMETSLLENGWCQRGFLLFLLIARGAMAGPCLLLLPDKW